MMGRLRSFAAGPTDSPRREGIPSRLSSQPGRQILVLGSTLFPAIHYFFDRPIREESKLLLKAESHGEQNEHFSPDLPKQPAQCTGFP